MKKLLVSCLLLVGTLTCGDVAATAAGNFFSTADQNLASNAAVTFEGENFYHKLIKEVDNQTILFRKNGFYNIQYSVTGSLAAHTAGSWGVGLYLNDNFVSASGNTVAASTVSTIGASIIIHAYKDDVLQLRSTTASNILLTGGVSGSGVLSNLSANISIIKIEESDVNYVPAPPPPPPPVS